MSSNNIHNTINPVVEPSNSNSAMTFRMLQRRTMQETIRRSTMTVATSSSSSPVKPSPESMPSSQGIGSNKISLLLQRRRQNREQGGTATGTYHHPRLLRSDSVKLLEEALLISTKITDVVPHEPMSAAVVMTATNDKHGH